MNDFAYETGGDGAKFIVDDWLLSDWGCVIKEDADGLVPGNKS